MNLLVKATAAVDELTIDGVTLLLVVTYNGDQLLRLTALGQLIREFAAEGITLTELTDELVAIMGDPGRDDRSAEEEVLGLVNALSAQGVLEVTRLGPDLNQ